MVPSGVSDSSEHEVSRSLEQLPTAEGLAGMRLQADGLEVQRSRANVRSRLFAGTSSVTRLGRFVLLEQLGAGGMGVVYAAYDPQLDRRVALKVLRTDAKASRRKHRQEQLLDEARAMAKLSHPNVITVYEVGTVDERVFIAMECLEGQTLRTWLKAEQRSPPEVLEVMRQAGEGLAAAHEAGLVHRDFKPENVLVSERGAVKVTDFGLARPQDSGERTPDPGASPSAKTKLAGTPAYMPPEQLRGSRVDARSDQWAFCVTLLEALQGRRPFDEVDIERLQLDPSWEPPSPTVSLATGLSRRQRAAVERGLSSSPEHRHPNMRSLLRALHASRRVRPWAVAGGAALVLAGTWVGSRVDSGPLVCPLATDRLQGIWDPDIRDRVERAFAAVEAPYAAASWERVGPELDGYAQAWLDAARQSCESATQTPSTLDPRREACLATRLDALRATTALFTEADAQIVEHAVGSVLELPELSSCNDTDRLRSQAFAPIPDSPAHHEARQALDMAHASWRLRRHDEGKQWALEAIDRAEALDARRLLARARAILGRFELGLAQVEAANEAFESVIAAGGDGAGPDLVAAAAIGMVEAVGVGQAEHRDAMVLARAAEIATAAAGNPPGLRSRLDLAVARVLYGAGEFDAGLERARAGLEALDELGGAHRPELAEALQAQATLLYAKGRLDEAEQMSTRALQLRVELLGPRHPAVAESQSHLAAIALARGRVDDAILRFSLAAEIQAEALGSDHPDYGRILANLGSANRAGGKMAEAKEYTKHAIEIFRRSYALTDPRLAALEQNLAGIEHEYGNLEEARRLYELALRHQREALGDDHPQTATTQANLGRLLFEQGEVGPARARLERVLQIRTQALGPEHPKSAAVMVDLAEVATAQRRFRDAATLLDQALEIYERVLGPEHLEVAAALTVRGKLEIRLREFAAAEGTLARAERLRETHSSSARSVAAVELLRAHALQQLGRAAEAAALAREADRTLAGQPLPPDLRSWCRTDCREELAALAD